MYLLKDDIKSSNYNIFLLLLLVLPYYKMSLSKPLYSCSEYPVSSIPVNSMDSASHIPYAAAMPVPTVECRLISDNAGNDTNYTVQYIEAENVTVCDDDAESWWNMAEVSPDVLQSHSSIPFIGPDFFPEIAQAECISDEYESKVAHMCDLSITGKIVDEPQSHTVQLSHSDSMSDTDSLIFAEIIADIASEDLDSSNLYKEKEVKYNPVDCQGESIVKSAPEEEQDIKLWNPADGSFAVGKYCTSMERQQYSHHAKSRVSPSSRYSQHGGPVERATKANRSLAIARWRKKRDARIASGRRDARQEATAKRERRNGKFVKRKLSWVPITDVSYS